MHHVLPRLGTIRLEDWDYFWIAVAVGFAVFAGYNILRFQSPFGIVVGVAQLICGAGIFGVTVYHGRQKHLWDIRPNPITQHQRLRNAAIAEGYITPTEDET